MSNELQIDSLLPAEMAAKAEAVGVKKANLDGASMFALAVLAGAFIALGAIFATPAPTAAPPPAGQPACSGCSAGWFSAWG